MSGRIPENIVERIKNETDIVMVISEFVSLKKSGKDYKGLCPFHQEKTPSFFVIPSKGFFHCFGCGKGGSAVNFIMEHERLEYPAALRYLAEKAGIEIPRTESSDDHQEKAYSALAMAAAYYSKCLLGNSAGKEARDYLRSRGMDEQTIRTFGLGFAPDGWDNLIKAVSSKDLALADLEAAGLVIKKEGYYDRFRRRLMIPVRTMSGKVVAFGGRTLPGDDSPKYINSPETAIYKKGRILYGMDISKNEIRSRNEAVVVEGYFDLISLYQAGIRNVVAVSGTGFTNEQASLLGRFCQRVVLLFDSDSAGMRAAFRACGVLYNSGLEPALVRLPKGFDPDTFVREKGARELSGMIESAVDIIDFVHQGLKGRFSDQTLSRQKRIIKALSELMEPVKDNLTRDLLSRKLYDRLEVDTRTIGIISESGSGAANFNDYAVPIGMDKTERDFIALLLAYPEFIGESVSEVDDSLFTEALNAAIYSAVKRFHLEGRDLSIADISEDMNDGPAGQRLREIAVRSENLDDMKDRFPEYLKKFRQISVKRRLDEIKSLISEAEKESDLNRMEMLTREFQNLKSEVKANDARI